MNSRPALLLVIAGSLAYACGPRSRSDAPPPLASASGTAQTRFSAPVQRLHHASKDPAEASKSDKDDVKLDARFDVRLEQRSVQLTLDVTNRGPKHLELNFGSGQSYDFVVLDTAGREVWRWANGRMFTQSVRNKQLGRGETMRLEENWDHPPAGRYTAVASLKSSNYPTEQRLDFIVP